MSSATFDDNQNAKSKGRQGNRREGGGCGQGLGADLLTEGNDFVVDWEKSQLLWGKPERKLSRVVLHKNAEESLDRAEDGAMNHDGLNQQVRKRV